MSPTNMSYSNIFLFFMIVYYSLTIICCVLEYSSNNSISNIICNQKVAKYILFFMCLMGFSTILYEFERNDYMSLLIIVILLLSIYGVILFDETYLIHFGFAFFVFISILLFMLRNLCNNIVLQLLFFIECFLAIYIILLVIITDKNIFYVEVIYLIIFALFYLYLHVISGTQ
jgi:hypothetical protein